MGTVIILLAVAFALVGVIAVISKIGQGPRPFGRGDAEANPRGPRPSATASEPRRQRRSKRSAAGAKLSLSDRWTEWRHSMLGHRGDWLPIVIGGMLILISGPPFIAVAIYPDPNSGALAWPLLVLFTAGLGLGASFMLVGIWLCAKPGFRALFLRPEKDDLPPAVRRFLDS